MQALPSRFHALDALRGVAALSVVLWHWQHFFAPLNPVGAPLLRAQQPGYAFLGFFYLHGAVAVQLFFCLSGFIFFWKYGEAVAKRQLLFARFAWWRLARLYPLHLLTLLVVAVGQWTFYSSTDHYFVYQANDVYHFVLNLFFAPAWGFQRDYSFNAPIWSVSIEILLYGLFFIACRLTGAAPRAPAILAWLLVGFLVGPFNNQLGVGIVFFFLGALSYRIYVHALQREVAAACAPWAVTLTLLAWGGAVMVAQTAATISLPSSAAFLGADPFAVLATLVFPLTVIALALMQVRSAGFGHTLQALGNISYSSYLLHFPLQLACATVVTTLGISPEIFYSPLMLLCFIVMLLLVSTASFHWFELPAQNFLRQRLPRRAAAT